MADHLKKLFTFFLLFLTATLPGFGEELGNDVSSIQSEIEQQIRNVIGGQLSAGEYFVYAKVEKIGGNKNAETEDSSAGALPFTSLNVRKSYLRKIFEKNNREESINDYKISVTLALDERIPNEKREMLATVIKERFDLSSENRKLEVKALNLVTPPIALEKTLVLEKEKLDSERAKMNLEVERAKLELTKKELEMAKMLKESKDESTPKQAPGEDPSKGNDGTTVKVTTPGGINPESPLYVFKEFQIVFFAVIVALVILIGTIMAGGVLKKGLSPLSDSIGKVGEGIKSAKPSGGSSEGAAVSVATTGGASSVAVTSTAMHQDHGGMGVSSAGGSVMMSGGGGGGGGGEGSASEKAYEEFISMVQEKIEVLNKEKNFGFYRQLTDMIEDSSTLPLAAALLATLDSDSAKSLLEALSAEHIDRLRNYLSGEGALAKAKSLRRQALQDFYGRIAMDEYLNSPLMALKDLNWLTKMSNQEIGDFILTLSEEEQVGFLASLTPTRAKKVIDAIEKTENRAVVISKLKDLQSVDSVTIDKTIAQISKRMKDSKSGAETPKPKVVDTAKYIASIAEDLSSDDQQKLWDSLKSDGDLLRKIRNYYIPFAYVSKLKKPLIMEIFGAKPNNQVAQILFDSSVEVQQKVIKSMPEIRAVSIEDELKVLQENKLYEKRNKTVSQRMQKEVSRFLLQMYKEGLIDLDAKDEGPVDAGASGAQGPESGNGNAA